MATAIQRNRTENLKYARDRESKRLRWIHQQDRQVNKQIAENMQYAMDSIMKEAKGWISTYAGKENITMSEALKLAKEADIEELARKAKVYVKNKDFSDLANDEMRLYNFSMKMSRHDLLLRNMDLELIKAFSDNENILSGHLVSMSNAELVRQAGILGFTLGSPEEIKARAQTIADESFHLAHFSDRIWDNQKELSKILQDGLIKATLMGQHPTRWMSEMRRNLTEAFSGSIYALKRLAVTESARVQIASQKAAYEAGGYEWFEFIAEPTACEICLAFDGKIAEVKKMMIGGNAPPIHPNCKCSTAAYVDTTIEKSDIMEPDDKYLYPDEIAGVKRGQPMSLEQANSGNPNPHYLDSHGYRVNCQSCVVTYEARLRGYDVSTLPKGKMGDRVSRKTNLAWIDPTTNTHPDYIFDEKATTPKRLYKFLNDTLDPSGRYTIEFAWKGRSRSGHIISLSKNKDGGLSLYDPQTGKHFQNKEVEGYFGRLKLSMRVPALKVTLPMPAKVLRVDDKSFNLEVVNELMEEFGK